MTPPVFTPKGFHNKAQGRPAEAHDDIAPGEKAGRTLGSLVRLAIYPEWGYINWIRCE